MKERFETMKLSYDAYRFGFVSSFIFMCLFYVVRLNMVGIQTEGGTSSNFSEIKATIATILNNNNIRSRRRLSIIFKALKVGISGKISV